MSIKFALPLLSLFVIAPTVSAEAFHHTNVQLTYAEDNYLFDSEHTFNDNVYGTGFIDRSDDISEVKNTKITVTTFGAGLYYADKINSNMQVYGGFDFGQNSIRTVVEGLSAKEERFFSYRPKVGVALALSERIEVDFNAAYNFAEIEDSVHDDQAVFNTPVFEGGVRYHALPALTFGATYKWSFSEDEVFDLGNVMLSVRLNFE